MIDVFVSRPTWVHQEFAQGLDGFERMLSALDLRPRTLGSTDYPTRAPLDEVIALLDECAGAVILGYPQITVHSGSVKDETVRLPLLLPTEWNHIEASLAYARDIPLLVIHHLGVTRGIFDRGAINSYIYERDLRPPGWPLEKELQGAVLRWKADCLSPRLSQGTDVNSGDPLCPNCSTNGNLFYMSLVPPAFQALEGASHECTRCGKKLKL